MGFEVQSRSRGDDKRETIAEVEFLVDTGVIYSLIPSDRLKELGIKPTGKKKFRQASGRWSVAKSVKRVSALASPWACLP